MARRELTSYKFGSFNMMNMGKTAQTKRDFDKITEIILGEKFDVVAFQEVLSNASSLKYYISNYLPKWEVKYIKPKESSDFTKTKDKREEGYAFAWNPDRLTLASSSTDDGLRIYEPREVRDALRYDSSIFARNPMYIRLVPTNGGFFEFRLINVHIYFGDNTKSEIEKRKEEYNFLIQRIYPTLSMERRYGNNRPAYTVVMGDYNLNLYKPRFEAESRIVKETYISREHLAGSQTIVTVQDELTTLKNSQTDAPSVDDNPNRGYSQNYDHFSFDIKTFEDNGITYQAKRVDAVRDYCGDDFEFYRANISDHIPVSVELKFMGR